MEEEKIECPNCGSSQLSANQRGWSPLTGMLGSGNVKITCLKCGYTFRPGGDKASLEQMKKKLEDLKEKNRVQNEKNNELARQQPRSVKIAANIIVIAVIASVLFFLYKACR